MGGMDGGRYGGGDLLDMGTTRLSEEQYRIVEHLGSTLLNPPASESETLTAICTVEENINSSLSDILPYIDLQKDENSKIADLIVRMLAGAAFIANRKLSEEQNG